MTKLGCEDEMPPNLSEPRSHRGSGASRGDHGAARGSAREGLEERIGGMGCPQDRSAAHFSDSWYYTMIFQIFECWKIPGGDFEKRDGLRERTAFQFFNIFQPELSMHSTTLGERPLWQPYAK